MLIKQRFQATTKLIVMILASAVVLGLLYSAIASAATANTLKISPVRSDIEIKPGKHGTVKVTVTNVTDQSVTVHPVTNDFISGDEHGTPALILDETKYAPTHSLKRFMQPIPDVTIPANQSKTVNVKIIVPTDAAAGGYFGAIRFAPVSPDDGGQVNLSASVASLVLLKVPGEITEKLELTNFDITQNGTPGIYFGSPDHIEAVVRFENKGDIQVGPFGKISVTQSDNKLVYETDFNNKDPREVVLPDSARRWSIPLEKIGDFGYYTVHGTFTYGEKNQTIEVTKSFWVIPMSMIIAAIGAILLLIGLVIVVLMLVRRRKRRRMHRHSHRGGLRHL